MSRSLSTIAWRWCLSRCAVAVLVAVSADVNVFAAPGNQPVRPTRPVPLAPNRVAQMPSNGPIPSSQGQQGMLYDGDGAGAGAPMPAEGYPAQNGYRNSAMYGATNGGYGTGCNGNCGGGCNGGCGGSCGCGDNCGGGCMAGDCGGCYGGCGDVYCGGDCGYGDCGGGCGGGWGGCGDAFCGIGCNQPRVSVYVDWLHLQVSDADVAHAQMQDGIGGAGTVPFGQIGTVDIDYDSGVRIGGSFGCGDCSGVTWSYTNFESYNEDTLRPPYIPNGLGAVGSLVQHPGAQITASAGPVVAAYDVDFRVADVNFRRFLTGGPSYAINYSFGAQYGHLEQFFIQEGVFSGGQGGVIDTYTNIDFDGGGLKVGLDGERSLCWGFHTYGRLSAAIMTGRFNSRYSMVNSSAEVLLARANWTDDRVVPQLEYEVGAGWTSPSGHWRFSAGYMLSHWANVVTTPEFIDAVQANNYTDVDGDLTFDGAVTRLELRW